MRRTAGEGVEVDRRLAEGAGEIAPSPSESVAGMADVLIDPMASPAAVRLALVPQHGVLFDA